MPRHPIGLALFACTVACNGAPSGDAALAPSVGAPPVGAPPVGGAPPGPGPAPALSGAALVLPVDDPMWHRLDGLLDEPRGYGEASWDDVRMRVAGHLATLGRDLARAAAQRGDWAACATRYEENADAVAALRVGGSAGRPIQQALVAASRRDAGLCRSLAEGTVPASASGTVAPLRAEWVALVIRAHAGEPVAADAAALAARATAVTAPTGLALDAFTDFDDRHRLRVRLVEAWADATSPFSPTDPWAYWEADEVPRQAAGIARAAEALAAAADPRHTDPLLADRLVPPHPVSSPSADELGALCTGDTLIDSAGFPGPAAIGSLARLGADDPEHRPWLEATAAALASAEPSAVPALVADQSDDLAAFDGGIRYYAIKQLRNGAVRWLAASGHPAEALVILRSERPLHDQDWACPNRGAILTALEGRLELVGGDPAAEATLQRGLDEARAFLDHVARVEARGGPAGPPLSGNGPPLPGNGPPLPGSGPPHPAPREAPAP